jgi:DNA-binding response OmpR family regulator
VVKKTVLVIDDEQSFVEALADALEFDGYRVLKASTATEALDILSREKVDLVTIDIMLDPGDALKDRVDSQKAGLFLCEEVSRRWPSLDAFCISVVSQASEIRRIEDLGIRFLRKGETPLRTVLAMVRSRLTGFAYSSDPPRHRYGRTPY